MASYIGSAAKLNWLQGSGTTVLDGDYRTFSMTNTIDFLDETAGADSSVQRIPYMKDATYNWGGLLQAGTMAGGTLALSTLTEGNFGTLIWSPEGTAAAKPKWTLPCYSMGPQVTWSYNTLAEVTVQFQASGTATMGTN